MPQKAPNVFQQFVLSFVPTKYDRLTKVKVGSMIWAGMAITATPETGL